VRNGKSGDCELLSYENCCKIFKSKALKIYVSHRLAGMGKGATLAIMAKTMRETDMFDQ
jgi:hypothetical protein